VYSSKEFNLFLKYEGITRNENNPHNPKKIGVVDMLNRSMMKKLQCMKLGVGLREIFWVEAIATTIYLTNKSSLV
jgi:hypothetical protein